MNFGNFAQELIINNQTINGIVNFAADLALIYEDILLLFSLGGAFLFLWGLWGIVSFKKPNSRVTGKSIALKCLFGSILYQLSFWMEQSTQSIWADAAPATPMSYVAISQSSLDSDPIKAMIFAIISIMTLIGWIFGGVAAYGFATMGESNDRHASFWKNAWMFLGAMILVNMMLFASDVVGSFMNVSGPTISVTDF